MAARDKATTPPQLSGHVELDETYMGGKRRGKGKGMGKKSHRTIVMGLLQRGGAIKCEIVPNVRAKTLQPIVMANVERGSTVSTYELSSYRRLPSWGSYQHGTVDHGDDEWVKGVHHVNGTEGFWSHLKRGIGSTHVSVSRKYLARYVNEFAFRYNNRYAPADMFHRMLTQISNKTTE